MQAELICAQSREEALRLVAGHVGDCLGRTLARSGTASFMASGGSSPEPAYRMLSEAGIDWSRVRVGLVDERWVSPCDPASNERLVRSSLLQGRASAAEFVPMKTSCADPADALDEREQAYAGLCNPISCLLLGMGEDGHTASWFPGADGLAAAMDPASSHCLAAIDAHSAPVAGAFPLRMTLTFPAICSAESAFLLIFGNEKRRVLDRSMTADRKAYPIRAALEGLASRLTIIWAE